MGTGRAATTGGEGRGSGPRSYPFGTRGTLTTLPPSSQPEAGAQQLELDPSTVVVEVVVDVDVEQGLCTWLITTTCAIRVTGSFTTWFGRAFGVPPGAASSR